MLSLGTSSRRTQLEMPCEFLHWEDLGGVWSFLAEYGTALVTRNMIIREEEKKLGSQNPSKYCLLQIPKAFTF